MQQFKWLLCISPYLHEGRTRYYMHQNCDYCFSVHWVRFITSALLFLYSVTEWTPIRQVNDNAIYVYGRLLGLYLNKETGFNAWRFSWFSSVQNVMLSPQFKIDSFQILQIHHLPITLTSIQRILRIAFIKKQHVAKQITVGKPSKTSNNAGGTIISKTIITNNMLIHVSTLKMSSSGRSLCLAKITYRFFGLGKIKLLKYKMIKSIKCWLCRVMNAAQSTFYWHLSFYILTTLFYQDQRICM